MEDFTLKVFYKLAQLKSFSKVAEELYITQSAVSRQIKNLEDNLAVKLCLREKEGISLTQEGRILLGYVKKILALYEKATKEIDHFRHTSLDKLIIGASTTLGEYVLPRIISYFGKKHPEADIYLRVANTKEILKQLSANAFNLALLEGRFDNSSFIVEKAMEDELVLIVSNEHRWAKNPGINFSELRTEPLIIREEGSGTRKVLEEALAKLGAELSDLNIKMELDLTEAVKNAVGENLGVSFVSKSTLIKKPGNIVIVPLTNMYLRFDFNLIYNRERGLTSLTLEFIECLKERLSKQAGV
ncbi:MAG: LysR substrate-binding domain-containing protein [bacterium]